MIVFGNVLFFSTYVLIEFAIVLIFVAEIVILSPLKFISGLSPYLNITAPDAPLVKQVFTSFINSLLDNKLVSLSDL